MQLKTILAGATALAIGLAVNAADWFSADIGNYTEWPTTEASGTWGGTSGAALTGTSPNKLDIDADATTPVTFTANAAKTLGTDATEILVQSSVQFNAFKVDSMPAIPENAKAGIIVVDNGGDLSYYGIKYADSEKAWVELAAEGVTPDLSTAVDVKITIKDDSGKFAKYTIGSVDLEDSEGAWIPVSADSAISGIAYSGCGVVSALGAMYTPNEYSFTVTAPDNVSVTKVVCGETELDLDDLKVAPDSIVTITYTADEGYLFSDGTTTKTQDITISANGQEVVPGSEYAAEAGKAKIGSTYYLTLNTALGAATADQTVTMLADAELDSIAALNADITLDVNRKVLTFSDAAMTLNNNVTIICAGAVEGEGVKNLAQITIAAGKTLDLSSLGWGAGLIDAGQAEPTAEFILGSGATYKQSMLPVWSDNLTAIFSASSSEETISLVKDDVNNIATITTAAKPFVFYITNTGKKYETFAELVEDLGDGDKVQLLADTTLPEEAEIAATCEFDLNGKTLTVASGKSFTVTDCELTLKNSVATVGGLVVAGSIIDNGTIDLWDIPYGVGGLIAHQGGSIAIGDSGSVKFMSAWAGESANSLMAKTDNFMTADEGATVDTGVIYTYNGDYFEVEDQVATAQVVTTKVGTSEEVTFTDSFVTLAAAVAAAKADTTITLTDAVSANDIATTKAVTLELNGQMLTLDDSEVLTLGAATAIVNGSKVAGSGLTINGQVVVNGSLDFSSLNWGVGGLIPDCAGSLKIGATSTVTFWAGNDPNAMESNKPGFLSESESGATFVSGDNAYTFDGSKWNLPSSGFSVSIKKGTNVSAGKFTVNGTEYDFDAADVIAEEGDTITITTVTYDIGFQPSGEYKKGWSTTVAAAIDITVAGVAVQPGADPVLPADVTPAEAGITNEEFKDAGHAEITQIVKWQSTYSTSSADINAAQFNEGVPANAQAEAYLLDCAPTSEGLATAKSDFSLEIEMVDGVPTVNVKGKTAAESVSAGTYKNGHLEKWGATQLGSSADWAKDKAGAKFFRFQLVK